jgi:thioredoxin reductase (NADPH)
MSVIPQMTDVIYDCVVIGGGPAGLTAAIYLARYHLDVIVIDKGESRAAIIPLSRNHAGFPEGISGLELLTRMRAQAEKYGATLREDSVVTTEKNGNVFSIRTVAGDNVAARTVLIATGVFNRRPAMPEAMHDDAVARGLLRYCPICDAYEITDQRVAVIGTGDQGVNEAIFLRSFTKEVTLISPALEHEMTAIQIARLKTYGIAIVNGPAECVDLHDEAISLRTSKGSMAFAAVYPALGSDIHSELAALLGAKRTEEGCIIVDCHQRSSIMGLYAAGDVVLGLDQMSHAMGQAGVAATAIRNDLCDQAAMLR